MTPHQPKQTVSFMQTKIVPLTLAVAFALGGCAQLPELGASPQLKNADAFQSQASFKAATAQWPADQWWTAYGDQQLNSLID